jgi:hypothetical protein
MVMTSVVTFGAAVWATRGNANSCCELAGALGASGPAREEPRAPGTTGDAQHETGYRPFLAGEEDREGAPHPDLSARSDGAQGRH